MGLYPRYWSGWSKDVSPNGIAEKDQDLTEIAASFPGIGDGDGRKQWGDLEEGMGWGGL